MNVVICSFILSACLFIPSSEQPMDSIQKSVETQQSIDQGPNPIDGQEVFTGFFVSGHQVYFVGEISIDAHHPETPDVYLEMFATAPDSREHESLVVSSVRPSLLHASLLAADLNPGNPIKVSTDSSSSKVTSAKGDRISLSFLVLPTELDSKDSLDQIIKTIDHDQFRDVEELVVHVDDHTVLNKDPRWNGLVFAGSEIGGNGYAADRSGALISLTPFGDEVVSPRWTLSHRESIEPAVWIANRDLIPPKGTSIVLRIDKIIQSEVFDDSTSSSTD